MSSQTKLKVRLAILNFLEFAVWGSYLTSLGNFLFKNGLGDQIGWFYAIQGIVSLYAFFDRNSCRSMDSGAEDAELVSFAKRAFHGYGWILLHGDIAS